MRHAPTKDFSSATMPPLPPQLEGLSTPELMKLVMQRVGEGCTISDFRKAPETCDLSEAKLEANIGAATRLLMLDRCERQGPPRPLPAWEADPSYRKELVREAGRVIALGLADTAAIVAALDRHGVEPQAMIALWDDFITEAIHQMQRQPRIGVMARLVADLEAALDTFDGPSLNAEARQLAHSMRVALEALRGEQQVSRHHVLTTVKAFAAASEWSGFADHHQAKATAACAALAKLWGL